MTDTIPHGSRRSVLFICKRAIDDPIVNQVSRELEQDIVRATTPAEGLDQARTGDFALILIGYSGDAEGMLETVRAVRANPRSHRTPIVALGLPQPLPFPQELLYDAGAIAVLTEPLSPTVLRAKARFYIEAFNSQFERHRAETELEQTRSRLQRIIEAAELGTWSWDIRADRVEADTRMAALFGVPQERRLDAPLATYLAAFHPDDVEPAVALVNAAIDGEGAYAASYRIRAAGGGWRWMIARGHVEYDDHG
ncbi:MAG: PAS domain-containing protein, partial [Burkholderiaceae bacterium]